MEFEYDERKNTSNKIKHGISFPEAQMIWMDVDRVEIPVRLQDEARYLIVGKIKERHWSAIITYRHLKVRMISVRRARKEEIELYES